MGIHDYGGPGEFLDTPPLGGPGGWAESVANELDTKATIGYVDGTWTDSPAQIRNAGQSFVTVGSGGYRWHESPSGLIHLTGVGTLGASAGPGNVEMHLPFSMAFVPGVTGNQVVGQGMLWIGGTHKSGPLQTISNSAVGIIPHNSASWVADQITEGTAFRFQVICERA